MKYKTKKHSEILTCDNEWIYQFIESTDGIESYADVIHFLINKYKETIQNQKIIDAIKDNHQHLLQLEKIVKENKK